VQRIAVTLTSSSLLSAARDLLPACLPVVCCLSDRVIPEYIRVAPNDVKYIHAIFWGYAGMTGGGLEVPITRMEHIFTLMVLLSGVTMYATLASETN
jgi:hypothetical protein